MSLIQIQNLSSLIVAIGVGLCATFGAQLTPKTLEAVTAELAPNHTSASAQAIHHQPKFEVEAPSTRVMTWWSEAAVPFSGGLFLIFLGSIMARRAKHAMIHATDDDNGGRSEIDINQTLESVIDALESILKKAPDGQWSQYLAEIKVEIEEIQTVYLEPLIEGRERIKSELGMESFIDLFGPIAQGERKLNRAWAACVDKHSSETVSSLEAAYAAFQSSLQLATLINS